MKTFTLPLRFIEDHLDRCASHPGKRVELHRTKRELKVAMDDEAFANLVSDLDYHSDTCCIDREYHYLSYAARACQRRLLNAGLIDTVKPYSLTTRRKLK